MKNKIDFTKIVRRNAVQLVSDLQLAGIWLEMDGKSIRIKSTPNGNGRTEHLAIGDSLCIEAIEYAAIIRHCLDIIKSAL